MPPLTRSDFGFHIALLARHWRQEMDSIIADFGVTDATWRPLMHLKRLGCGVMQRDLAASLGIEGPSLVRLLDGLEAKELVRRCDGPDRRAKLVVLTPAGTELAGRIAAVVEDFEASLLSGISDEDIAHCGELFQQIGAALAQTKHSLAKAHKSSRTKASGTKDNQS